ncbi:unnamed protein product [Fraxinus pennsylvanica]|uniref:Secreted protein n=1 Tax=Fraxinus pennsylvanica TaxID=56036 RepID=A0AAD1ZF51_9LAMI|nr:unnamed protein product [Fraxinus pennsylvanica]
MHWLLLCLWAGFAMSFISGQMTYTMSNGSSYGSFLASGKSCLSPSCASSLIRLKQWKLTVSFNRGGAIMTNLDSTGVPSPSRLGAHCQLPHIASWRLTTELHS